MGCPIAFNWINVKEKRWPSNTGTLRPILSNGKLASNIQIEVRNSGVIFNEKWGLSDMLNIWGKDQFTISIEDGHLKVSTIIRDGTNNVIAELIKNEWKVASPPAWDRNYTDDALEVKNAKGQIVLQVKMLIDKVQLQGVWWKPLTVAGRLQPVEMVLRVTPQNELPPNQANDGNSRIMMSTGSGYNAQMVFVIPGGAWPSIEPIFSYPSETHFGELR